MSYEDGEVPEEFSGDQGNPFPVPLTRIYDGELNMWLQFAQDAYASFKLAEIREGLQNALDIIDGKSADG